MSAGRVDLHTHLLPDGYRAALARHELEVAPLDRVTAAELFPRLRAPQPV